jgi:hypothetical protein
LVELSDTDDDGFVTVSKMASLIVNLTIFFIYLHFRDSRDVEEERQRKGWWSAEEEGDEVMT